MQRLVGQGVDAGGIAYLRIDKAQGLEEIEEPDAKQPNEALQVAHLQEELSEQLSEETGLPIAGAAGSITALHLFCS